MRELSNEACKQISKYMDIENGLKYLTSIIEEVQDNCYRRNKCPMNKFMRKFKRKFNREEK